MTTTKSKAKPKPTTEVAVVDAAPLELVQPLTGELIRADDVAGVGEAIRALREHKREVDTAISAFTAAAIEQSRAMGTKTLRAGGVTIKLGADSEIEWDVTELVKLLAAGLPPERYAELVTETLTYKVNASVAKQIEGANAKYAPIIDRARVRVPKRQTASVG